MTVRMLAAAVAASVLAAAIALTWIAHGAGHTPSAIGGDYRTADRPRPVAG